MAARDRVAEIIEIKSRRPKAVQGFNQEFEALRRDWEELRPKSHVADDFFVIRAVTLLEVFTRLWTAALIDHGPPYVERAAGLRIDLKFDFSTLRAVHGQVITMGELLSHSIFLNTFGQILDVLSTLLSENVMALLGRAVDSRTTVGELMKALAREAKVDQLPIIREPDAMRTNLSRLFELRHILCHEFPRKEVYDRAQIAILLDSALQFALATNEVLGGILRGDAPNTIEGMITEADRELEASEIALAEIVSRLDDGSPRSRLLETANEKWVAFRDAHSDYKAAISRGVVADWLRTSAAESLTRARIEDLQDELQLEGDE